MKATSLAAHPRVRRLLVFLVVVWSIGGVFLVLEAGLTEFSWFSASKSLRADLVLPKQSQAAFVHCQEVIKRLPAPVQDLNIAKQTSYLVWRMGYMLGSADASVAAGIANQAAGENVLRQSVQVTSLLGIPPLALPQHGRSAYALREFSVFLEEDPSCVAAALQFRYSPKHAALYKFGAAVGFVSVYRRLAPQLSDVLTPQLRIYAAASGIPADLYTPLLGQPLAAGPAGDAGQAVEFVVNRIDAYVRRNY
jgi:hypothetical protein